MLLNVVKAFSNSNYINLFVVLVYFLVSILILRFILPSEGTIGFFHDWPFGPFPEMTESYVSSGFYIWDSQYGNLIYPTDWILKSIIHIFLYLVNISGEILTKGILIITLTFSGFGAFYMSKKLGLGIFSSFFTGMIYIFSPIIFTRIVAGYVYYLISYLIAPFVVAFYLQGANEKLKDSSQIKWFRKYKNFIIAGLIFSFSIQFQFFIMIPIILGILYICKYRDRNSLFGILIVVLIPLLINMLPYLLSSSYITDTQSQIYDPSYLINSYHEILTAPSIFEGFRLLGYSSHPYSYSNIGSIDDPIYFDNLLDKIVKKELPNRIINSEYLGLTNNSNFESTKEDNNIKIGSESTESKIVQINAIPLNWTDVAGKCNNENEIFLCKTVNITDSGVIENQDLQREGNKYPVANYISNNIFQISTTNATENQWSYIASNEIPVKPEDKFVITSNIKQNEFVTQSHVVLEGFNETSGTWQQIIQCPSGLDGQSPWTRYMCYVSPSSSASDSSDSSDQSISKVRLVLHAGWSSEQGKEAITYFGSASIDKFRESHVYETDFNNLISYDYLNNISNSHHTNNISISNKLLSNPVSNATSLSNIIKGEEKEMMYNFTKINPTLWKVSIDKNIMNQNDPFTLVFAEGFDPFWQAQIYNNGSLVYTSNSKPLYGAINSFEIDPDLKNGNSENLEIFITYLPQELFETGIKISLLSMFGIFMFLLIGYIKKNRYRSQI